MHAILTAEVINMILSTQLYYNFKISFLIGKAINVSNCYQIVILYCILIFTINHKIRKYDKLFDNLTLVINFKLEELHSN